MRWLLILLTCTQLSTSSTFSNTLKVLGSVSYIHSFTNVPETSLAWATYDGTNNDITEINFETNTNRSFTKRGVLGDFMYQVAQIDSNKILLVTNNNIIVLKSQDLTPIIEKSPQEPTEGIFMIYET